MRFSTRQFETEVHAPTLSRWAIHFNVIVVRARYWLASSTFRGSPLRWRLKARRL
ncbi:MAG: hypothetical protein ACREIC_30745 [Limisphaerales bacterium]